MFTVDPNIGFPARNVVERSHNPYLEVTSMRSWDAAVKKLAVRLVDISEGLPAPLYLVFNNIEEDFFVYYGNSTTFKYRLSTLGMTNLLTFI